MQPETIINDRPGGILEIKWDDGVRQRLTHATLRAGCRCADCKTWRKHGGDALAVSDAIQLDEIRPVGVYGVQLVFSDGHERGIYPWAYLRDLDQK